MLGTNFFPEFSDGKVIKDVFGSTLPTLGDVKEKFPKYFEQNQVEFFQFDLGQAYQNRTSYGSSNPLCAGCTHLENVPSECIADSVPVHAGLLSEEFCRGFLDPGCDFEDYYGINAKDFILAVVFPSKMDLLLWHERNIYIKATEKAIEKGDGFIRIYTCVDTSPYVLSDADLSLMGILKTNAFVARVHKGVKEYSEVRVKAISAFKKRAAETHEDIADEKIESAIDALMDQCTVFSITNENSKYKQVYAFVPNEYMK